MSAAAEDRLVALEESVEAQEEELRSAVGELESAARRAVDARNWIRSRPLTFACGALLVGYWLGGRR